MLVTDSPGQGKPDALFVVSLESGEKRQLTNPLLPSIGDSDPAVSPDGRWIVFRRDTSPFTGALYAQELGQDLTVTGEPRRLTATALDGYSPTWTADNSEVLFSARAGLWRIDVAGKGQAARLPFVGEDGLTPVVSRPQPARPTRLVYVRSFRDTNIWRVESSTAGAIASSPPAVTISSTRRDDQPDVSPDGRRVALISDSFGRTGDLDFRHDGLERRPAHNDEREPGIPALVSRRVIDCVPLESRGTRRRLRGPGSGRQASKPHLPTFNRRVPELLGRRPLDSFRVEPNW